MNISKFFPLLPILLFCWINFAPSLEGVSFFDSTVQAAPEKKLANDNKATPAEQDKQKQVNPAQQEKKEQASSPQEEQKEQSTPAEEGAEAPKTDEQIAAEKEAQRQQELARQKELEQAKHEEYARKQEEAKAQQEALAKESEEKRKEIEKITENDPWKDMWLQQRATIDAVMQNATSYNENFTREITILSKMRPIEDDIRRLIVLSNNFRQWPNPLEAVSRRLSISAELLSSIIASASAGKMQASKFLIQVEQISENLSQELANQKSEEIQEYVQKINKARFLLTAIISRYESSLAPAIALNERIQETKSSIDTQLPQMWKSYYLQKPVPWLVADEWKQIPDQLKYFTVSLDLRKPVEIPITANQWQTAIIRFIITLVILTMLSTILCRTVLSDNTAIMKHIQRWSMPWNVIGLSLLAASMTGSFEPYRALLSIGNLCLIMGQIFIAWDLRRIQFPNVQQETSPLWHLIPLTICAYLLLYLPLPKICVVVAWNICLIGNLTSRRFRKPIAIGDLQIETVIFDLEPAILWLCLVIGLFGMHICSMAIYLLFTSLSIATELSMSSMSFMSRLNEKLPREGVKSLLASLLLAISAPIILIVALCAVSLWLATLPGGIYMLQYYIFKSVNIGQTELNSIQFIFIITMFFLARTISRMGKNFITKLPHQTKVDASLVTPLQTAFIYFVWALFGLFVLRSLGMNLSSLAVIAGGLSVGIGFGMQTIVNNFISGLILIFSRALRVGDVVEVAGVTGRIKQITVRATVVETYNSATIYVPNSEFVSGRLTNWTSNSRSTRTEITVGVAYGTDTQKVTKILLSIAEKDSDILAFPKPSVLFTNFGESTLDFKLLYWVKDYDLINSTGSRLRSLINQRFESEKIEIAYKQLDVRLTGVDNKAQTRLSPKKPSRHITPLRHRKGSSKPSSISLSKETL